MTKAIGPTAGFGGKLLTALNKVDRPGEVCASGDLPLVLPGLEVEGVGTIRFPLGKTQANQLIRKCTQAPYGKGTKTVVDTRVRRVWELDPQQFELTNPGWDELIAIVVGDVQKQLGLERAKLTAHLYKLLVYERGSFFKPHRDGEKLDGMVATLVVALPAVHSGGALVVTHEGRCREIELNGAASGHGLSFAAFYADCEHEVLPVKEGYRVCLVYNLALTQARRSKPIAAPRSADTIKTLAALMQDWPRDAPAKLAIALDHRYSKDGLRIDALKGVDRARVDALLAAAEQADCLAYLALVTHWQSGSAEGGDFYGDYYDRRNRYRYRTWSKDADDEDGDEDEDDDDSSGSDGTGYEMGEVFDESLSICDWSDRAGKKVDFGEMPLDEGELVSAAPLDAWEVAREEFEGYTGNAGMTLERWYHRAAVVVWPRNRHFAVLCRAGTDAAIAGLEAMVEQSQRAGKTEQAEAREDCLRFARAILDDWQQRGSRGFYSHGGALPAPSDRSRFAGSLMQLEAPELLSRFISQVMPGEGDVTLDKSFLAFGKRHGWASSSQPLATLVEKSDAATLLRNARLLELLGTKADADAARRELCRQLAEKMVDAVAEVDAKARRERAAAYEDDRDDDLDDEDARYAWRGGVDRCALLASLVKAFLAVGAADSLRRLLAHARGETKQYGLTKVHLKAAFALEAWLARRRDGGGAAIAEWLAHCRSELERRTASAPQPPADFRRDATWGCKCEDCREMKQFLADPLASERGFPLAEGRRAHLHHIIQTHRIDSTHDTRRTGRPYTLVCKKTTASFERACEVFSRDVQNLKQTRELEARLSRASRRP